MTKQERKKCIKDYSDKLYSKSLSECLQYGHDVYLSKSNIQYSTGPGFLENLVVGNEFACKRCDILIYTQDATLQNPYYEDKEETGMYFA